VMKVKTKGATNEAMDPLGILSRLPVVACVRVAEADGGIVCVSSRSEHLLGLTPDQFAARPLLWDEIVHQEDRKSRRERRLRACNDAGTYACTHRVRGRDDALVWVRDQATFEIGEESGQSLADLLLTDVVMPDMSGSELVARLQQLGVAPPTRFMSGHADEMIARHKLPDPDAFLLQKPFVAEELLEAVRAALDAGGLQPKE
jgi:CheY-like chemotaxis protein